MRFRNLPLLAAVQLVALFVFASCIPQASSASSRALPQAAVAPLCKTLGTMSVSYGRKSKNVVLLQHFLNQNDNAGLAESGFFGKMTKAALASFQEEYANEILIPSGLTLGSGNYGRATKKKISTLCYEGGKGAAIKPIVSTSANPAIKNSVVSTSTAVFTPPVSVVHSGGSSGGGGGGGGGSSVTLDPVILFTSATGTVPFNGTTSISWSASNATDCHSSNSTSTSVTGSFITSALATTTAFSVTCNNGSKNATKQVMVNVIPDCVNCFKKRWVYFSLGDALSSSSSTSAYYQKFFEIVDRAKAAGYNGIAVNSSGSGDFETMLTATSSYFNTNMAAMRAKASSSGMELIPIGGSPNIPQYVEPSLVEAMPVNGTPFIVSGATATPVGAHIGVNDDFESGTTGWTFGDGLKLDATVAHSGTSSVMFTAASSTSRLIRSFSGLKPHTAYRVSLWVKSNNYDGYLRTRVYGINSYGPIFENSSARFGWTTDSSGAWIPYPGPTFSPTQNWTNYNLDFNTENYTGINFYVGQFGQAGTTGNAWVDDVSVQEIGLQHAVRRPSLTYTVTATDTSVVYTEGVDYSIATGSLKILPGSNIYDGESLLVSWYQSTKNFHYAYGPDATACDSRFYNIEKNYFDKLNALFGGMSKFFLYYDEMRDFAWDPSCGSPTAGTYLANMFSTMRDYYHTTSPNADIYVWDDMFNPYANATTTYYGVNGDISGSWNGLGTSTEIVNWSNGSSQIEINSMKFFSARGNKQLLALYYDDPTLAKTKSWLDGLSTVEASGTVGVDGFMYTTWYGNTNYGDLENVANYIKTNYSNRWPTQ